MKKLQQRYSKTIDELIAYRDTLDAKEVELQKQEDDLSGIDTTLRAAYGEMRDAASTLSKARAKVAKKLAADAQKHLADLGMPKAKLDAAIELISLPDDPMAGDVPAAGIDQLEFMLTANPGEPARPLRKVASGGELSRAMLALKTVLAAHDPVRTLVVFDEIDANVGGRLGDILGQKLAAAGPFASGAVRDALAAGGELRGAPVDDPQNHGSEANRDDHHAADHGRCPRRGTGANAPRLIAPLHDSQGGRRDAQDCREAARGLRTGEPQFCLAIPSIHELDVGVAR